MDPWAPARPPQPQERQAGWGARGEAHRGPPPQPRRQLLRTGPVPRPGSRDGGHHSRRDTHRPASRAECYDGSHPNRPYSRQGSEDPPWRYPAASYRDHYTYQSQQWQPVAWQDDRDLRQGEPYGKSTNYWDQHYYRGYHPNLATSSPGQDRMQTYDSYEESYISVAKREQAGGETLGSDSGEAGGQPREPSLLLQYRESGLSSSSYELSQYIRDGANHYDPVLSGTWSPAQAGGPLVSTLAPVVPFKFSLPHVAVCFGAGGQLVLVCPHCPAEGQLAHVELHSLEVILQDTKELEELQAFPGPLAREDLHKVDVMTFCQQKIATSCDLSTQRGRDSALLWKLLVLLCQQNGSMVGSDTAELLMQDCRGWEKYKRQNPAANLIGLTDDEWTSRQPGTLDLITGDVPPIVETQAQIVEKFTKLLYYGRKKDALVWAMRNQLWGHALFLSSKMDPRTYSWVLSGFTSTLATKDPLQTLFQLMSGRIPQAALCCGDATWGDWRPHLAVMLSNKVGDMELNHRAIVTMGDTLAGRGAVEAAHFCYLMADVPFSYFGAKADRMALLGSSHRQAFAQFARTEVIQRMEIFEYCQQLQQPESFLLPFQVVYKLLYASRLADYGLPAQALQYCEQIATALLGHDMASHPVLAQQLMKLAERLKLSDPLLLEMPEQDQMLEPDWLVELRAYCQECEVRECWGAAGLCYSVGVWVFGIFLAGEEPGHELPQSEGYQYGLWYQPMPPQGPSSHQDVSPRAPTPAQVAASPLLGVRQELQPPPQMVPPPGKCSSLELKARARAISESSTVSLEDDSQPSSESTAEDTAKEPAPAEAVKPSEDKSSGFRWFGWFRSKPTKETSPKATSEMATDSPTPGPQVGDKRLSCPRVTPSYEDVAIKFLFFHPFQSGSHGSPPPVGTVPLFNPAQVSQLAAAARSNQPRLLSQRRYPNPL
ncbi:SC16B protein, partial [Corythaixoides concolor]|nr:SC16B protein [Corythaixoides concolor]